MADDLLDFEIEWDGLKELKKFFKTLDARFIKICIEEFSKFGITVEETIRLLAPRDTGELEESINAGIPMLKGKVFELSVGTNKEYALAVHERPYSSGNRHMYRKGVRYDNYYQNGRGTNTRLKAQYKGYTPGRKFIQNGVKASEDEWIKCLERVLKRALEETS